MENKPERLIKKTFIACIRNSVGTRMFRSFFLKKDDKVFDAMKNGDLSCAFYVSGLLKMADLVKSVHGTVEGTVIDLEESGWIKSGPLATGSVIVWEAVKEGDELHKHIGFYLGKDIAISNSSTKRKIVKHDWLYNGTRKIEAVYSNPNLK